MLDPARQDLIQISYSDLDAYHRCARRYYYEKRLRMGALPPLSTTAVKRGTLMHMLLEGARDGRINKTQAAVLFAREQLSDPGEQEALCRATQRVLDSEVYAQICAGADLRRERQFYLALRDADRPTRFLKGYIDIQSTRKDGSLLILDYKSGTREDAKETDYEDQARCYALIGLADGHDAVEARFIRPEVFAQSGSAQDDPAPQVFVLGPYTHDDYSAIESGLIASIHEMERTGPQSPLARDRFTCEGCPVSHSACPGVARAK